MSVLRGRVDELRRLHALPVGSDGGLVLLGEAGMGKTALLDALPANGCTSLSVRGIRAERSLPFAALHRLLPFADAPSDGRDVRDLLVSLAADRPVLCRVDDAQWLDRETLEVLGFVARRLAGCRVTMVLAARPEPVPDSLSGLDRMWLRPLAGEACEQRLRDVLGRDLPAGLTAALVDLTGGNPADLVALAAGLTPDQVAGRSPLPDELPEGPRRAELGDEVAALSEHDRLRVVSGSIFSKIVRSTMYALMPEPDRRAAHAKLASSVTGPQRLWHRAMATPGLSASLADSLADVRVDDPAEAAMLLERAAYLTVHPGLRGSRFLEAARQAWYAGRPGWARLMLSRAAGADIGRRALLHGEIELRDGDPAVATHELATAAEHLVDPGPALRLSGEARRLCGDVSGYRAMARTVRCDHFTGLTATFEGRHTDAVEPLRRVVRAGNEARDVASAVWAAEAAFALGRGEMAYECASAAVGRARLSGQKSALPWALVQLSLAAIVLDRHKVAVAASTEGLAASAAQRNTWTEHLSLLGLSAALRGDQSAESTLALAAAGIAERGLGRPSAIAAWAEACLDLAADRPADALGRLETMAAGVSGAQPAIQVLATPQLVEAAVQVDQPDRARQALQIFDAWVHAGASSAWLALSHRCHGLLDPDNAEHHFETAVDLHRKAGAAMELARTQMAYANRLRRQRRSGTARALFRDALRVFETLGADGWSERARAGLRATGETVATPETSLAGLTPQQTEISRLVAVGETNKEIARRLVISHRTVDHHLRNIFTALGVRSRVELTRRVTGLETH